MAKFYWPKKRMMNKMTPEKELIMKFISPLRYPGGKAKIAPMIRDIILENCDNKPVYCEPFAGGAGIAFKLLEWDLVSEVIINDLDKNVYAFWCSLLNNYEQFITKFNEVSVTVSEWKKQKKILHNEQSSMLERGFAFFFMNRCNRSGIIDSNPIGGIKQTGNYKIDVRFNKSDLMKRFQMIMLFKDRIKLSNIDGLQLISTMDNDTFYFLDPPYYIQGRNLYSDYFMPGKHEELSKILKANQNKKWVLTYDTAEPIEELYKSFNIKKYQLNYTLSKKMKAEEFIIYSEQIAKSKKL
jgi:DNA adenine methylase